MPSRLDVNKLMMFLEKLGESATSDGNCYLTGGTSALLIGWRDSTIDADIKFDPEPSGVFDAIAKLKYEFDINVELASPDDFIPPLMAWKSRSRFIGKFGRLTVFHYDFTAQALSKLARGHERDIADVNAMLERGLVTSKSLSDGLLEISPDLKRYPAIDENDLQQRVRKFLGEIK